MSFLKPQLITLFFLGVILNTSFAKETLITDSEGRSLKVKLLSFSEGKVDVINLSNRKKYTIPLDKLEEHSQKIVQKWVKNGGHLSVDFGISFQSGKKDRSSNSSYSYSSARVQIFSPEVTVENSALGDQVTRPVKMVAVILAKPANRRGEHYVLAKEKFDIPSLDPHKSHVCKLKEFEESYYDSRYSSYKSGNKYCGYAIFLVSNDEVVSAKYLPSSVEKQYGEKLLKAQASDYIRAD